MAKEWTLQELPEVEGKVRENVNLSKSCWFQVGGSARFVFKPKSTEDLANFFAKKPLDLQVCVLGVGSNVIIKDSGYNGVVIKFGRDFNFITEKSDGVLHVGSAVLDVNLAEYSAQNNMAGLEFFAGIPGTIGGAIAMNAGAYGSEIKDVLISCEAVNHAGEIKTFSNDEIKFEYRKNRLRGEWIFTSCLLKYLPGEGSEISQKIATIQESRASTQPIRSMTGGSTFKNPQGHKAWELIDKAGCRGLKIGGASVSQQHCNFLINDGSAKAQDILDLIAKVKAEVKSATGVNLEEEIKIIG
ncbi:UNVERIFIED_CONTAM: hypothetical protein GTU68_064266 [Idotea baltica]|nr:hypothetical protein [Idotea baltica]